MNRILVLTSDPDAKLTGALLALENMGALNGTVCAVGQNITRDCTSKAYPPVFYVDDYGDGLLELLEHYDPDIVLLLYFNRLLEKSVCQAYDSRIINLHGSLLPNHKGRKGLEKAWEAQELGFTWHYVVPEMDSGPIIRQIKLQQLAGETVYEYIDRFELAVIRDLPVLFKSL